MSKTKSLMRTSDASIIQEIEKGIKVPQALKVIQGANLPQSRLTKLLKISSSTFAIRKKTGILTPQESERFIRFREAYLLAVEVFDGKKEVAREWFDMPLRDFDGKTPMEMLETGFGFEQVKNMLHAIEYGVYL